MKIGIITYHFATNYGAVLQAFALQTYLRSNGHEVEFINYNPTTLKSKVINQKSKLTPNKLIKKINTLRRTLKFNSFRKKLVISNTSYSSLEELEKGTLNYDAIICGSDQIWNPLYSFGKDFPHVYYLNFSYKGKKISYAPSFGTTDLDSFNKAKIKRCLKHFYSISVREKSSVSMLKDIGIDSAHWVPDPTLLLDKRAYDRLLKLNDLGNNKYIFSYVLHNEKKAGENLLSICQKSLNITDVFNVNAGVVLNQKGVKTKTVTPERWLTKIKNSNFVITNSYHACIFSIIFNIPFLFIAISGKKKGMNERVFSLFEKLGIENRIVFNDNLSKISVLAKQEMDWENINTRLSDFKEEGKDYLARCLNN